MTLRQVLLNGLSDHLAVIPKAVTLQNQADQYDINTSLEHFFKDFLNLVYDLSLINMNSIQKNFPAIDLGDESRHTCFQVTATSKKEKLNTTLETFKRKGLDEKYKKIIFLIISDKPKVHLQDDRINTDTINIKDIFLYIKELPDSKLSEIKIFIEENLRFENSHSILPPNAPHTEEISYPKEIIDHLRFTNDQEAIDLLIEDLQELKKP